MTGDGERGSRSVAENATDSVAMTLTTYACASATSTGSVSLLDLTADILFSVLSNMLTFSWPNRRERPRELALVLHPRHSLCPGIGVQRRQSLNDST